MFVRKILLMVAIAWFAASSGAATAAAAGMCCADDPGIERGAAALGDDEFPTQDCHSRDTQANCTMCGAIVPKTLDLPAYIAEGRAVYLSSAASDGRNPRPEPPPPRWQLQR